MALTVAYCRVSTDEQASEGFSIEGQTEKLRAYATLHDLGEVVVISDPGLSGKDLNRPGLQKLLQMVDDGHVSNILTWRLDRLSRNLADLILLADRFGQADISMHSFTEKIDLSSATGRMFYNILGSFAQFYREQLSENVRMGMAQAIAKADGSTDRRLATTSWTDSSSPTAMQRKCAGSSGCALRERARRRSPRSPASTTRPWARS